MRIHEFMPGQDAELAKVFKTVLPQFSRPGEFHDEGPARFLSESCSFAIGAYADDVPAGLVWGLQIRSPNGQLTSYVHELEVGEQWRKRGIAKALMKAAFDLARRRGSTRFWLTTRADNTAARSLYESLGGAQPSPSGSTNYWWQLSP